MTRKEAIRYAQACSVAKANGEPKPERPENAATVSTLNNLSKTIVTVRTTLDLLNTQMEMIVDFLSDLQDRSPQAGAYAKLADNIWGSMMDAEKALKQIR